MAPSAEEMVKETIVRYAYLVDHNKHHLVAEQIYAPHARLQVGEDVVVGREAIHAHYVSGRDTIAAVVHQYTNHAVRVTGAQARSICYATAWMWLPRPGPTVPRAADMVVMGVYQDELELAGDDWVISDRRQSPLGVGGLAAGSISAEFAGLFEGFLRVGLADPVAFLPVTAAS